MHVHVPHPHFDNSYSLVGMAFGVIVIPSAILALLFLLAR